MAIPSSWIWATSPAPDNRFANSTPSTLKPENFSWHTEDGEQPFTIAATALDKLEESLADVKYGAGAKNGFSLSLLKSKY